MNSWGIIGIGRIGLSMARNMSSKGITVSLYDKAYEEKTNFSREVEIITSSTLEIQLSKLNFNSSNNIIKLDVQGSEIDILKGLGAKISFFEIIILETSVKEYNKGSPLFIDVVNYMNKTNYTLYDIFDLKRLGNYGSFLVQFDAIFVKKNSSLLKFDLI